MFRYSPATSRARPARALLHRICAQVALLATAAVFHTTVAASTTAGIAAEVTAEVEPRRLSSSRIAGTTSHSSYPALAFGPAKSDALNRQQEKAPVRQIATARHSGSTWIYSADIQLTSDPDLDGHYSGFSINIDVDTLSPALPVYAVLYLSYQNGPWNEYLVSGNFTVSGSVSSDAIFIETTLEQGYPSGHYDHLIEIYDAGTHGLLTSYGPNQSSFHVGLAFEGNLHEGIGVTTSVALSFTGTGSFAPGFALLALPVWWMRRRRSALPTISSHS